MGILVFRATLEPNNLMHHPQTQGLRRGQQDYEYTPQQSQKSDNRYNN